MPNCCGIYYIILYIGQGRPKCNNGKPALACRFLISCKRLKIEYLFVINQNLELIYKSFLILYEQLIKPLF